MSGSTTVGLIGRVVAVDILTPWPKALTTVLTKWPAMPGVVAFGVDLPGSFQPVQVEGTLGILGD